MLSELHVDYEDGLEKQQFMTGLCSSYLTPCVMLVGLKALGEMNLDNGYNSYLLYISIIQSACVLMITFI